MKRIILILSASLMQLVSYSQEYEHTGSNFKNKFQPVKSNQMQLYKGYTWISGTLYDSGGVTLSVKEYYFDNCGSGGQKNEIYKCVFRFKNTNSYPVIIKGYKFSVERVKDSLGKIPCEISGPIEAISISDTLTVKSEKVIRLFGETLGSGKKGKIAIYGCVFEWAFDGFIPLRK